MSFALLGVLVIIGLGIYAFQFRYDPAQWRAQSSQAMPASDLAAQPAGQGEIDVAGLQVMSAPEFYDARSLSDKINGKAELYLSAGFERLESRRFALSDNPSHWMEMFVYDMGGYSGAFSVYSQQRRGQALALTVSPDAYRSANGIFMVQGRYYVEIIGSDSADVILEKMTELARLFVQNHPAASAATDERTLFPKNGLVADSISLTAENAFGFEPFDQIYSAQYQDADRMAAAFLSRRASADQAAELVDAYIDYLMEYGGRRIDPPADAPPVVIIEIMDMFEIIFQEGPFLAGIHEAGDLSYALRLAGPLHQNLSEAADEP